MISEEKQILRTKISLLKKQYTEDELKEKSIKIFKKIEKHPKFLIAQNIMLYWSITGEVFTHDFIEKYYNEKNILLPSINGDDIVPKKYTGNQNMILNSQYKIEEPEGEAIYILPDIIIVPGIAFDKENNRMGRGKAFYDKFLSKTKSYKIGICFDFQYLDKIPADQNDIKMNEVITD